ncbi:MAG: hypothetical protein CMJ69_06160 [Planctomycetaceae bacterium]|nr:hypothetical protein [Planctomycetaceae bacterium]
MCIDSRPGRTLGLLLATGLVCSFVGCNPMSAFLMNRTGLAYYESGDYTAATKEFQRAVADHPNNPDYIYNLASAVRKQGQIAKAEQFYRQALEIDPGHQPSYHGLARLMVDSGRGVAAAELLGTWATAEVWRPEPHIELAWLARESGNTAGAERHLLNALRASPSHPVVTAHLGQLYQDSGQSDRATAMYQRSLFSDWYQPEVRSRLASLREQGVGIGQPTTTLAANPNPSFTTPVYNTVTQPTALLAPQPTPQPTALSAPQPTPQPGPVATPQPDNAPATASELPVVTPR